MAERDLCNTQNLISFPTIRFFKVRIVRRVSRKHCMHIFPSNAAFVLCRFCRLTSFVYKRCIRKEGGRVCSSYVSLIVRLSKTTRVGPRRQ